MAPPPSPGGPSGRWSSSDRSTASTQTRSVAAFGDSLLTSRFIHRCMSMSVFCTLLFQDSPEFDLVFYNAVDQWVASSSAEKCIFVQILYHACQTYWEGKAGSLGKAVKLAKVGHQKIASSQRTVHEGGASPSDSPPKSASRTLQARRKSYVPSRQTEFINCQSKLTGGSVTWLLRFMIF